MARPQTMTEKILAAHSGRTAVQPGDIVMADVDLCMGNDITTPIAIKAFEQIGAREVFDRNKIALIPSHFVPAKDIASAEQARRMTVFAREQAITHYYEIGRGGIEHALLPELGLVRPGMLIVGADSHSCTYGALNAFGTGIGSTDLGGVFATGQVWLRVPPAIDAVFTGETDPWITGKDLMLALIGRLGVEGARYRSIEFRGPAADALTIEGRLTMANMAIEAGGKSGIFAADAKVDAYLRGRTDAPYTVVTPDPDARYDERILIDVSGLEPQVARPFSPDNVAPISTIGPVPIDQVVIGSCTNGRIEDLRQAAAVLQGQRVHPHVKCLVFPATQQIWQDALREGLFEIFASAGVAISAPTCGPCLGGHMGVLAPGERAVSTTNRNFRGRMGHRDAEVYLTSPAVAAASAVTGYLAHPREVHKEAVHAG